jgi:hypothetical protein
MASAQDWYARHFGGEKQSAPPVSPQGYQPPPGYTLVPVEQTATQVMPWENQGRPDPWQQLPAVDTSKIPRGYVKPDNFMEMAQYWRGGQGAKSAEPCPECNGVLFRRFNGRMEAAPMCTQCGWNGLFSQGQQPG